MDHTVYNDRTMAALQQWIENTGPGLFPRECALGAQRYDRPDIALPIPDDATLNRAVEKRRREFSAGRVAAEIAFKKAGIHHQSIPIGPDRNPVWPEGISGSITHTSGLAVAVIAPQRNIAAIGIDLEVADAVRPELWQSVLGEQEVTWLATLPAEQQTRWATVIFCAKESFYKMQNPLTHQWVDFNAAHVTITRETGKLQLFCTETSVANRLNQSIFPGRFIFNAEFIFTAMCLKPALAQPAE